jgi:hypothetical protein
MARSRRGRRKRRAMIEGILITGLGVCVVAVLVVMMTRTMVYHGNGARIRPPASVFTPRTIR